MTPSRPVTVAEGGEKRFAQTCTVQLEGGFSISHPSQWAIKLSGRDSNFLPHCDLGMTNLTVAAKIDNCDSCDIAKIAIVILLTLQAIIAILLQELIQGPFCIFLLLNLEIMLFGCHLYSHNALMEQSVQ